MRSPLIYLRPSRFRRLSLPMRVAVLSVLALEALSLPAAAQIVQRVSFSIPPIVVAVKIPNDEPGVSRFIVKSNAGFNVKAAQLIGAVRTDVTQAGLLHTGVGFGHAAQLPGAATSCAQVENSLPTQVYTATRKTAASSADPVAQSVVFTFHYAPAATPEFNFEAVSDSTAQPQIRPCEALRS